MTDTAEQIAINLDRIINETIPTTIDGQPMYYAEQLLAHPHLVHETSNDGREALTDDQISYPRDVFCDLVEQNSPYAFYIFQWVPYQTEAKKWRLKMEHDVKHFDGRIEYNIWPNGNHCGSFKDEDVEFIRISKSQFGEEWKDPRD